MKMQERPAGLQLVHHEIDDDGFAYSIGAITRLIRTIQEENQTFLGIKQDALWQEGRLDRHAITHAIAFQNESPSFTSIMSLGDALVMASVLSVAISSATAINQPAWRACEAMAEPCERFPDRGQAMARLIFIPEAMLVVPDDDFAHHATIEEARDTDGIPCIGSIWTMKGHSHHGAMASRAAADAARKLVARMLNAAAPNAPQRNIMVDISREPVPA